MYRYMKLEKIKVFEPLMKAKKVSKISRGLTPKQGFLQTYKQEKGNIERMKKRTVKNTGQTWHEKRELFISRHMGAVEKNNELLFINGIPTRRTLALYAWAFDPSPKDTKKYLIAVKK